MDLSKDLETEGFDLEAGQTWIYPTNYPIREYQFNIVQKALLENTLVSLPTGLGKTFIAAVVMYNYFRWFPLGKIIFMAPTKPLVKQQIDACYDIMAIPKEATVELTGTKLSATREKIWNEKRVFFITPQILQNDLDKFESIGSQIKCLVFDEAHKARGNHAYCEVIRKLSKNNKYFRVLALSATPGAIINDVLEVIQNLLISHLEVRTEESLDVKSYVFQRNLTTVVVPLGEKLQEIKDEYLKILDINTRILRNFKVIEGNYANLTKGKIFILMKNLQQNYSGQQNRSEIMKCLNACIILYHGYDLLIRHGLRGFLTFFDEHKDNPLLKCNIHLFRILDNIREYLGPPPNIETLPDGNYPEISKDVKFGHPKYYKLRDILELHFKKSNNSSRVIVFFEYRDSVMEAYALLIQSRPLIKPRIFLGQRSGITQRIQINVVKAFREGLCNTLLSTSIGEEGLDVGEVDLIICFDISNKSPIRMVQRMGRTGRKKEGSVIILVTEGKEQQTLKDCLIHKSNITHHVLGSREISKGLMTNCPRLVPKEVILRCEKMFITVKKPIVKKTSSLKEMFRSISSSSSEPIFSQNLKIVDIEEKIPESVMLFNKEDLLNTNISLPNYFNKRIEKQRNLQEIHIVKHSKKSEMFVDLLRLIDSKRFNIPMSQIGTGTQFSQHKNLKQTDIRNIFFKSQSVNDFTVPSMQVVKTISEEKSKTGSQELFSELSTYLCLKTIEIGKCRFCRDFINCQKSKPVYESPLVLNWVELDTSVFSSITVEDLKLFEKSLDNGEHKEEFNDSVDFSLIQTPKSSSDDLIDKSIFGEQFEKSYHFEAPKFFSRVLEQFTESDVDISQKITPTQTEQSHKKLNKSRLDGDIQNEILEFFKLDSLSDMFDSCEKNLFESQETIIYSQSGKSPDMFDESPVINTRSPLKYEKCVVNEDSCSPILCTFDRRMSRIKDSENFKKVNPVSRKLISQIDTPWKFTMNRTKVSSTPLNSFSLIHVEGTGNTLDVNDLFDFENVSEINSEIGKSSETKTATKNQEILSIEDLFDMSFIGDLTELIQTSETKGNTLKTKKDCIKDVIVLSNSPDLDDFQDIPVMPKMKTNESKKAMNTVEPPERVEVQVNKTKTLHNLPHRSCSPEITITQLISLVNKDDYTNSSSQKENIDVNTTSPDFTDIHTLEVRKLNRGIPNTFSSVVGSSNMFNVSNELLKDKSLDIIPNIDETIKNLSVNITHQSNPSEDEFETKPESPTLSRLKPNIKRKINRKSPKPSISRKRRKLANEFIEDEAELSPDDFICISDDEEDVGDQDCYESSFVADETHHIDTQMHCKYLQSIRSPVLYNRFKVPRLKSNKNIFSQEVNYEDDTYLEDSFVVHENDIKPNEELSQLEILEQKLKIQRKKKWKNGCSKPTKRKRIIEDYSDDSS